MKTCYMTMEPTMTADHTLLFTGERNGPQLMLFAEQESPDPCMDRAGRRGRRTA